MATTFKKTQIKSFPKKVEKENNDSLYWKHLEFPITRKNFGAVTHIDISPVEPYRYAVTSSTKVEIFHGDTHELYKTLTKFKKTAYGGSFRSDGKLIVAGGEEGLVKLFDVDTKSLLRQFRGHKRPVHVTKFTADKLRVMSGGDDNVVRLFDVPSEVELASYSEHEDYIRGGAVSIASSDFILTGSYDHTARLFDTRMSDSVVTVNHGCPIEAVLMHPGGSLFYTAGGETIKVWDALAGGRLLQSMKNHHKTVTSLGFCSDYKRLVSCALDRHVKFYDVTTYQVVHSLDYMSALLSVAIPPDDSSVSVGMTDGHLVTQRRRDAQDLERERQAKRDRKNKSSFRYRVAAKAYQKQEDDEVITHKRKEYLANYDKLLRKFEYSKVLTAVMDIKLRRIHPEVTFSVMHELIRRDGLRVALAGRSEQEQQQLVTFLIKNISNVKFTSICIDVSTMFIDIYNKQALESPKLMEKIKQLKGAIDKELQLIKELYEITGVLDTIFATSQYSTTFADDLSTGIHRTEDQGHSVDELEPIATTQDSVSSESSSDSEMENS